MKIAMQTGQIEITANDKTAEEFADLLNMIANGIAQTWNNEVGVAVSDEMWAWDENGNEVDLTEG